LEAEKPRMGTTASVQRYGRDSTNYTTTTELRPVVSKEEIMALPNLNGYWKHEKFVVPFRIRLLIFKNPNKGFVERSAPQMVSVSVRQTSLPYPNGKETNEILPDAPGDLDISF